MSVNNLLLQKEEIIGDIRDIEEACEGIDNKNKAKKITALNMDKSDLLAKKNSIVIELNRIEQKLNNINEEINNLSSTGIDRILEAIKEQRWYFFKNKPKVLMDRETGLLWPNLDYFEYIKGESEYYTLEESFYILEDLEIDGYSGWEFANKNQIIKMIHDKSFPFQQGNNKRINDYCYWICFDEYTRNIYNSNVLIIDLDDYSMKVNEFSGALIPCYNKLTNNSYAKDIIKENKVYTEREKLEFTLNIFINNGLQPIFKNEDLTELYKKIYIEKPLLLEKLNELQEQINEVQQEVLLSSTFNYKNALVKYDIEEIDNSVIKYYEAVNTWIDELMDKMKYYESVKSEVIRACNVIGLTLSKKYEDSPNLTDEENSLLKERQSYFKRHFELGMSDVNSKLLAVKRQAQDIEDRIDDINNGNNSIKELALLENESRASFSFIAENTANIIKNALIKIEYFEKNMEFVTLAVKVWDEWTEDYKVFKISKREELKNISEGDGIEKEVWERWYTDWNNSRFIMEKQLLPLIQRGLKGEIITNKVKANEDIKSENIIKILLEILKEYKEKVDDFYLEERKGIYQKFAFQVGGDLQEKFEAESRLFKITATFQEKLQQVIFSVDKVEDRMFLLEWSNSLTDLQIDEILYFIKDKELSKISQNVLREFADLKCKNYDIFISDAKSYSQELARRENQYNSLIFKMRKDLMKQ